ncbi:hypothetical protein CXIVA_14290 [Clostridium sp. SY8519]|uniref:hypothetical protein n=1 Tax=Clostridium sp. (strain SY8519) TaxID=1042156 RepID=UPI0002172157|nr:hypothetical protein [Clostridium sp. SY8519]BAK47395.1 hypothetical protein CXIVA_14290 [Clostridium sp. SY8519]
MKMKKKLFFTAMLICGALFCVSCAGTQAETSTSSGSSSAASVSGSAESESGSEAEQTAALNPYSLNSSEQQLLDLVGEGTNRIYTFHGDSSIKKAAVYMTQYKNAKAVSSSTLIKHALRSQSDASDSSIAGRISIGNHDTNQIAVSMQYGPSEDSYSGYLNTTESQPVPKGKSKQNYRLLCSQTEQIPIKKGEKISLAIYGYYPAPASSLTFSDFTEKKQSEYSDYDLIEVVFS